MLPKNDCRKTDGPPANGREIDMRISSVPTINGESLALRLLDPSNSPKNLNALNTSNEGIKAKKTTR